MGHQWGTQTLDRGISILEAVGQGATSVAELATVTSLNQSTVRRIVCYLSGKRYLSRVSQHNYVLGPKALELSLGAKQQLEIAKLAKRHIQMLAKATRHVVHLGILDKDRALLLEKESGGRRVEIRSRVGEGRPLCSTALGKALLLDNDEHCLLELFRRESTAKERSEGAESDWLLEMKRYASIGWTLDLEEYVVGIRCVAAPIRDISGSIVGAVSSSSAVQYIDMTRMDSVADHVRSTAEQIGQELGWNPLAHRSPVR